MNFYKYDNINILELAGCGFYIYFVIFLFFIIKPTIYTILLFFTYCFITTYYILEPCSKFRNNLIDIFFVFFYSLGCVLMYYIIHTNKNIILNSTILKIIVLGFPIYYLFVIRVVQKYFNCKLYHIFFSPLRFFIKIVKEIKKHRNKKI